MLTYIIISLAIMLAFMGTVVFKSREDIRSKKWSSSDTALTAACTLLVGIVWFPIALLGLMYIAVALVVSACWGIHLIFSKS